MTSPAIAQPEAQGPCALALRRMWGLALRHYYLHAGSWPRLIEMLYWPIVNMATWGFTSSYLVKKFTDTAFATGALIASVILVEVLVRVSTTMLMLFMEEVWSRNLGHLFASPIRFREFVAGTFFTCLVRTIIALTPAVILAKYLFGYSIFDLGWNLAAYAGLLVLNGCWYGMLIIALLLRFGMAAEWVAWMCTWLLIPFIAPYYPVSTLPHALQMLSYSLPATYVFECVKAQFAQVPMPPDNLLIALGLNVLYFILAGVVFWRAYQGARERGGLLQVGE
ncbi:MAG TPA: ABC transporter permease [Alphaproteobacteria bacterium]|nr:ABC transporter permease [Alphaproteobacteria bacterium]